MKAKKQSVKLRSGATFEVEIVLHEHEESVSNECGRSNMHYALQHWKGTIEVLTPFGEISCEYCLTGDSDGPEGSVQWRNEAFEADELAKALNDNEYKPIDSCGDARLEVLGWCSEEVEALLKMATEPASPEEVDEAVEMLAQRKATLKGKKVEGKVGQDLREILWRAGMFLRQESLASNPQVVAEHAKAVLRTREQGKALLAALPPEDKARKALETLAGNVRRAVKGVPRAEFLERMGRAWDEKIA